ncbi:hypothetical protein GCM10020256_09750 [Streptomyces thermocoprophilus]
MAPGAVRGVVRDSRRRARSVAPGAVHGAAGDPGRRRPAGATFLPTGLGVRRAARRLGLPSAPAALTARAEARRPWRAYAVRYLWATDDHPINSLPARARQGHHSQTRSSSGS